jgi:hypothetical protein
LLFQSAATDIADVVKRARIKATTAGRQQFSGIARVPRIAGFGEFPFLFSTARAENLAAFLLVSTGSL